MTEEAQPKKQRIWPFVLCVALCLTTLAAAIYLYGDRLLYDLVGDDMDDYAPAYQQDFSMPQPVEFNSLYEPAGAVEIQEVEPDPYIVEYPLYGSTSLVRYIESGILSEQAVIDVSYWGAQEGGREAISDAVREAMNQNPYLLANSWQFYVQGEDVVFLEPIYRYSTADRVTLRLQTRRAAAEAMAYLDFSADDSERDKVKAIYEYVARIGTYDDAAADAIRSGNGQSVLYSQHAFALLLDGKAVCGGYAKAFQLLAREAGIDSVIITGQALGGADDDSTVAHAWNRVMVDGEWVMVDVTWADSGDVVPVTDKYLMVSLEDSLETRTPDDDWAVEASVADFE